MAFVIRVDEWYHKFEVAVVYLQHNYLIAAAMLHNPYFEIFLE